MNPETVFKRYDDAITEIATGPATADDEKLLDLSLRIFENDARRHASIDSRAAGMMAAIGLAATLVTGIGFTTFKDPGTLPSEVFWVIFVTFCVALLYLTATAVLSFRIQGSITRYTPDPIDLVPPNGSGLSPYPRAVAAKILRYTVNNYRINNRVVGLLYVAQKCFRNALVVLVIGGLIASGLFVSSSPAPSAVKLAQALARSAGCSDMPTLKMARNGAWSGSCLHDGRIANVSVTPEGLATVSP